MKVSSTTDFALARYNADGSADSSFGNEGKIITYFSSYAAVNALAIQSDGKIVAVGGAHFALPGGTSALARYNTDGSLDSTFHGGRFITNFPGGGSWAGAVAIQSDEKIVIAGVLYAGNNWDFALARYNTDGTLDSTFGTAGKVTTDFYGGKDYASGLAIQLDGKIVAAGVVDGVMGDKDFALARYNIDGTLDTNFGINGKVTTDFYGSDDEAYALVIQFDEKIVVAGSAEDSSPSTNFALARYNSDGSFDSAFGNAGRIISYFSGHSEAKALAIQFDGKIVVLQ